MKFLSKIVIAGATSAHAFNAPSLSKGAKPLSVRFMSSSDLPPPPTTPPRVHYLLRYDYVSDIMEKRAPHRAAHLGLATKFLNEGSLVMAGAAGPQSENPPATSVANAGVFVFSEKGVAEEFVKKDAYYEAGLVADYAIKEWVVPIY